MAASIAGLPVRPLGRTAAVLLSAALASGLWIWWMIALPMLSLDDASLARHPNHLPLLMGHVVGGTLMLYTGAAALYIGSTRRAFRWHQWVGYTYVLGGALGAGAALVLALVGPHPSIGTRAATGSLALVWLLATAMAWRAARNRRFEVHRGWMIRSYVLTWSFVLCRIVQQASWISTQGKEAETAAIWLTWVLPLVVCEVGLQWSAGGRPRPA